MADNNPIEDYRKSLDHVQNAERQVGKLIKKIQSVANGLDSWKQYSVSNVGVSFPSEVTYDRSRGSLRDQSNAKKQALVTEVTRAYFVWGQKTNVCPLNQASRMSTRRSLERNRTAARRIATKPCERRRSDVAR